MNQNPKFRSMSINRWLGNDEVHPPVTSTPSTTKNGDFIQTLSSKGGKTDPTIPAFVDVRGSMEFMVENSSCHEYDPKNRSPYEWQDTHTSDGVVVVADAAAVDAADVKVPNHSIGGTASPMASSAGEWTTLALLPPVPPHAPLERTALRLKGPSLVGVVRTISTFMKMNSIRCVYHPTQARVDCLTCCGLKFVVQLWRDDEGNGAINRHDQDDEGVIIIEVQRRRGCSVAMRTFRGRLYRAVMALDCHHRQATLLGGRKLPPSPVPHSDHSSRTKVCGPFLSRFWSHERDEEKKSCRDGPEFVSSRLRGVLDLLEGRRTDENRLGMDLLLLALTRPGRVDGRFSEEIARGLAFGEPPVGTRLRMNFLKFFRPSYLLYQSTTNSVDCSESQDVCELECASDFNCDLEEILLVSLNVLKSCLNVIITVEQDYLCNAAMMLNLSSDFWTDVLEILIVHLEDCQQRPQEAALSASCLYRLETLQPFLLVPARRAWTMEIVIPLLRTAHAFGVRHHLLLEQEANNLLEYVQRTKGKSMTDDLIVTMATDCHVHMPDER